MDVNKTIIYHKKIRLFLVFFCILFVLSCTKNSDTKLTINVNYDDGKALSVTLGSTRATDELNLFLQGTNDTPILGDFVIEGNELLFKPIVPFTNGNTYEVYDKKKNIGTFSVAELTNSEKPILTALYPSTDTIPENLLKIYLVFSKPMQEVQNALSFIDVYNNTDDISTTIFLELENELWNADHTELTLWLDPGRIKTDLIPNRTKGLPIEAGKNYTVTISNQWKDAENNKLDKEYVKHVYVTQRDSSTIMVENWAIKTPKHGTVDALTFDANEPLDAMLALETMRIMDAENNVLDGIFKLTKQERVVVFIPTKPWMSGKYRLSIMSILEDLAGNNLNHLFDVDLNDTKDENERTDQKELSFNIL